MERARARIEKEEQEKLKAQQEITEAQNQMENQAEVVTEQGANENPDQNQVVFVEPAAPRMTPEEEKEAYAALERVRARILKEDEERAGSAVSFGGGAGADDGTGRGDEPELLCRHD